MLSAYIKKSGAAATVVLKGPLDESAGKVCLDILPKLLDADVVFDCAGIGAINSIGFRHWILFLKSLSERSGFTFVNCPRQYFEYAGLLVKTAFASRIASVLVPYRCDSCGKEDAPVFDVDEIESDAVFADSICGKCNGIMRAQIEASAFAAMQS